MRARNPLMGIGGLSVKPPPRRATVWCHRLHNRENGIREVNDDMRGRKPKPTMLRLVGGNAGKRPLPPPDPLPTGTLERPANLRGAPAKLWDSFITKCFWLTWAEGPKAAMWCHLQAEFDAGPKKMQSSRIAQLRALGSDLGFDQVARTRMGVMGSMGNPNLKDTESLPSKPDVADKYFS